MNSNKTIPDARLIIQIEPDEREVQALRQRLVDYNIEKAHTDQGEGLAIFVRDGDQQLVGGIYGWLWGVCLEVDYLWVHEEMRGRGVGRELLQKLEEIAADRGCQTIVLDTYSFQAPEFYREQGYEMFGEIDGYGDGHQKLFFRKRLG